MVNKPLLIACTIVVSLVGCGASTEFEFQTAAEMRASNGVIGAALPEFVPDTATKIHGGFHVETDEEVIEFTITSQEIDQIVPLFNKVDASLRGESVSQLINYRWKNPPDVDSVEFFVRNRPDDSIEYLAIDKHRGSVYYWLGSALH